VVRSGQSLWLIAALYDLTLEELMELNDLTPQSVIRAGDQLLIRQIPTATVIPPTNTPAPQNTAVTEVETAVVEIAISPAAAEVNSMQARPEPNDATLAAQKVDQDGATDGNSAGLIAIVALVVVLVVAGIAFVINGQRQS
jgi:hypothetical protein